MKGWIGEQRGKFLEMSAQVLILKSLDNSLTHFFTHQTFLKDLLEGTAAGAAPADDIDPQYGQLL